MPAEKIITITWRDENYGYAGGDQAFRYSKEPWPSETERTKISRIFRKHGFEANMDRAAWIAQFKPADSCVNLVEALREAGYPAALTEALEAEAPSHGM
jgi:hypothetical protein